MLSEVGGVRYQCSGMGFNGTTKCVGIKRAQPNLQIEADLQRLREQQESFVTKCARLEAECDTAQAERLDYNNSARVHMGIQEALEAEVRQSQQDCFEMESQLEKSRRREAEVTAQCKALAQQLERCKQQMVCDMCVCKLL